MKEVPNERRHSVAKPAACVRLLTLLAVAWLPLPLLAAGTDAGVEIQNVASVSFEIGGVTQTAVASNPTVTFVDELIDSAVVSDDAGAIGVGPATPNAVLRFTVTNTGNGTEFFRLVADASVAGDDFDPTLNRIYLESNGLPGLQTGAGGDAVYLVGSDDPQLAEDESLTVYVDCAITGNPPIDAEGAVTLRAVSRTVFLNAGTDDPADGAFPQPGTAYAGAGDPNQAGSGNVTAVVGSSHDPAGLVLRAEGRFRVSSAVLAVSKTATAVLDPFGGTTLVPGSVISYRIDVAVSGSGDADAVVVTDVLPAELDYLPGSLVVSALPAGEEADDDFSPAGADNTGYDATADTLTVNLGSVPAGGPLISITFDAAIR